MPKELKAPKFVKNPKAVKSTITSKTLTFIYDGKKHTCDININDREWAIYMAFRNALAGIFSEINIHDKNGTPLPLKYHELKTNIEIHVSKDDKISQGAGTHSAATKVAHKLLVKILGAWKLEKAEDILPEDIGPRQMNNAGQKCTAVDVQSGVGLLGAGLWTAGFVKELYKLSQKTLGVHSEAVALLREMVAKRRGDKKHQNRWVVEVLTRDVIKALKRREEMILEMAEEASELATYAGPGNLMPALEEVEREPVVAVPEPQQQQHQSLLFSLPFLPGRSDEQDKK
jgi:hypothetical protein